MSLGYKIIESSKSEKTDENIEDNSDIQKASDEAAESNAYTKEDGWILYNYDSVEICIIIAYIMYLHMR